MFGYSSYFLFLKNRNSYTKFKNSDIKSRNFPSVLKTLFKIQNYHFHIKTPFKELPSF